MFFAVLLLTGLISVAEIGSPVSPAKSAEILAVPSVFQALPRSVLRARYLGLYWPSPPSEVISNPDLVRDHADQVARIAVRLAQEAHLFESHEINVLEEAAWLHDIAGSRHDLNHANRLSRVEKRYSDQHHLDSPFLASTKIQQAIHKILEQSKHTDAQAVPPMVREWVVANLLPLMDEPHKLDEYLPTWTAYWTHDESSLAIARAHGLVQNPLVQDIFEWKDRDDPEDSILDAQTKRTRLLGHILKLADIIGSNQSYDKWRALYQPYGGQFPDLFGPSSLASELTRHENLGRIDGRVIAVARKLLLRTDPEFERAISEARREDTLASLVESLRDPLDPEATRELETLPEWGVYLLRAAMRFQQYGWVMSAKGFAMPLAEVRKDIERVLADPSVTGDGRRTWKRRRADLDALFRGLDALSLPYRMSPVTVLHMAHENGYFEAGVRFPNSVYMSIWIRHQPGLRPMIRLALTSPGSDKQLGHVRIGMDHIHPWFHADFGRTAGSGRYEQADMGPAWGYSLTRFRRFQIGLIRHISRVYALQSSPVSRGSPPALEIAHSI